MNIRELVPKTVLSEVPYITNILNDETQLAFALTEIWQGSYHDSKAHVSCYTIYRKD